MFPFTGCAGVEIGEEAAGIDFGRGVPGRMVVVLCGNARGGGDAAGGGRGRGLTIVVGVAIGGSWNCGGVGRDW